MTAPHDSDGPAPDEQPPAQSSPARKWAFRLLKAVVFGAVIYYWCLYVERHWRDLSAANWRVDWTAVALACLVTFLGYLLRGCLWAPFRRELIGKPMGCLQAFGISSISWMGRYLPGKVWAIAGKAYLSAGGKQDIAENAIAVTVDILWFQISGLILGSAVVFGVVDRAALPVPSPLVAALIVAIGLVGCHPRVFCPLFNRFLAWFGKPPLSTRPRYAYVLLFLLGNMISYALWASGLAILAATIAPIGHSEFASIVAVFSIAWVCGFLAVFAPAGIGVRDSILALGLQTTLILTPAQVVFLVVASRLLSTVIEMLCALLSLAGRRAYPLFKPSQTR
ncbi:MAG: flippase-like domain-containing protein [Phycisphaerae bacterium]|nr:flippase-like domain-containing protein [Phycisphaerae bacterium]